MEPQTLQRRIFWDCGLTALFGSIGLTQKRTNFFYKVNIFSFAGHTVSVVTTGVPYFSKVRFTPPRFYERPTLVPVFTNLKKPKENFYFYQ